MNQILRFFGVVLMLGALVVFFLLFVGHFLLGVLYFFLLFVLGFVLYTSNRKPGESYKKATKVPLSAFLYGLFSIPIGIFGTYLILGFLWPCHATDGCGFAYAVIIIPTTFILTAVGALLGAYHGRKSDS